MWYLRIAAATPVTILLLLSATADGFVTTNPITWSRPRAQKETTRSIRSFKRCKGTVLAASQNSTFHDENPDSNFLIEDGGLLVSDVVAIVVASQLVGLLDVVNDPDFAQNGGWFQPIPVIPSTLGILIQRISLLCSIWFTLPLVRRRAFSFESTSTVEEVLGNTLWIVTYFSAVRLLADQVLSVATGSEPDFLLAVRDCYVVSLAVGSFRFLYGKYVR